jgi:hypothetical protein
VNQAAPARFLQTAPADIGGLLLPPSSSTQVRTSRGSGRRVGTSWLGSGCRGGTKPLQRQRKPIKDAETLHLSRRFEQLRVRMLVSMRACCALGGLARLLVWGLTTSFFVGHAGAQVLRDPPTQSGPPHYDDSFTEPVTIAGVSIGLRDIPLGDDPDWFVDLGGSRHGGVPARRSRRVIAHPYRNLLDTVTAESVHGEA